MIADLLIMAAVVVVIEGVYRFSRLYRGYDRTNRETEARVVVFGEMAEKGEFEGMGDGGVDAN